MATTYIIRTNSNTLKSGVHAEGCSVVAGQKKGRYVFTAVQADSAKAAAAQFDADNEVTERGLKCSHTCECSR